MVGLLKLRWVLLLLVLVPMVLVGAVLLLVLRVVLLLVLLRVLLLVLVLRAVLLLVLRLVLVVALVPGGVVADIVVSLTIVSLIVRENRKGWSTRTPLVGLAMRSRRRDYFLASMVESPETSTALLGGREATRIGVGGCYGAARWCGATIVVARFLVLASTSFFVSTSLFET
jgi:hypothetical protein